MTTMNEHLDQYLAQREALGTGLSSRSSRELKYFADFAMTEGQSYVTDDLFLRWKDYSATVGRKRIAYSVSTVRVFAKWLQAIEPLCEVPSKNVILIKKKRQPPYIYKNEEIANIVTEAAELPSYNGLRGPTYAVLFGLLAVTGLRVGEALGLDDSDVDTNECVLHIKHGKNGDQRLIPITSCTAERLVAYQRVRDGVWGGTTEQSFFRSWKSGQRIGYGTTQSNFAWLGQKIGLREKRQDRLTGTGPRLHDLRHTFATRTIISWLRKGYNIDREIYKLSTFLGHTCPSSTYWYLEAVPEIMALTMRRAEGLFDSGRRPR